ncbi:MAG: hypothetical protein ACJ8CN_10420, partial [Gemmatimonadales bacterium]
RLEPPVSRRRPVGLMLSLAFHAALLAALVARGEKIWGRTPAPGFPGRSGSASTGGGGGGPRVAYITLPSLPKAQTPPAHRAPPPVPTPRPVVSPPVPPPEPQVVAPVRADTTPSRQQSVAAADSTSGGGGGTGAGNAGQGGPGSGKGTAGAGGGTGGGAGGKARPPEPRDMAFPFDNPPKELRGLSLNVTFWVRPDGRVERYLVEPQIKDRDYAKKFDEVMRAFRFTPARAPDGTFIPGTARISFTLPGKSSS